MVAAIDKCYRYGREIQPILHLLLIALLKSDRRKLTADSVSDDRVSCRPYLEQKLRTTAVIVTRAHCCLTAAGRCYVMLGTIKFVDKSVNDNSARRLDHCDVIALRSGLGVPTGVPHSEVEFRTEFKPGGWGWGWG